MNAEILRWLLAAHAFFTLFMTGLIWFVQVVHEPLFDRVGKAEVSRSSSRATCHVQPSPFCPILIRP